MQRFFVYTPRVAKRVARLDQPWQDAVQPYLRALSATRGAQADFARDLGVTPAAVAQWKKRGVPAKYRYRLRDWFQAELGVDIESVPPRHTTEQQQDAGGVREAEARALKRQTRHALHAAIVSITKRINREFSQLVELVDRLERQDGLLGKVKSHRVSRRR